VNELSRVNLGLRENFDVLRCLGSVVDQVRIRVIIGENDDLLRHRCCLLLDCHRLLFLALNAAILRNFGEVLGSLTLVYRVILEGN